MNEVVMNEVARADDGGGVTEPIAKTDPPNGKLILAWLWAATAIIVAIVLWASTPAETYGGDAYTGIQDAVVAAVRGIGFMLIGSGALGLILAMRHNDIR